LEARPLTPKRTLQWRSRPASPQGPRFEPGSETFSSRRCKRRCWFCLADRQVHQCRHEAERDVRVPHPVVAARRLEGLAAERGAEEAADLVRKHYDAEERGFLGASLGGKAFEAT